HEMAVTEDSNRSGNGRYLAGVTAAPATCPPYHRALVRWFHWSTSTSRQRVRHGRRAFGSGAHPVVPQAIVSRVEPSRGAPARRQPASYPDAPFDEHWSTRDD